MNKVTILILSIFCFLYNASSQIDGYKILEKSKSIGSNNIVTSEAVKPNFSELDTYLSDLNQKNLFGGTVLIAQNNEVLYQKDFPLKNKPLVKELGKQSFQIGSLTKQFVAAIIMKLVAEGKIHLNDTLSDYLEYPNQEDITIKSLLNHTSGIPNYIFFKNYNNFQNTPHTTKEMIDRFSNLPLEFIPETNYNYTNSGYYLLGAIIEKLTNASFEEVLEKYITKPLHLNQTGFGIKSEVQGYDYYSKTKVIPAKAIDLSVPFTAGGMYSTATDLQKWTQSLFEGKIVSKNSLLQMITPEKDNYGLGFWIHGSKVWHTGGINGFRTIMSYDIQAKSLIIILSNIHQAPVIEIEEHCRSVLNQ